MPTEGVLGMTVLQTTDRAQRLVDLLPPAGVDALLVSALLNVRYMTGYTGSNGLALVGPQTPRVRHRLSLRRAGRGGGRLRLRSPARPAGAAGGDSGGAARGGAEARLRRRPRHRPPARQAARAAARAGRAGARPVAWSSACGRSRSPRRSSGSAWPRRPPTPLCSRSSPRAWPGAPSAELAIALERAMARAGRHAARRLTRSWPPVPTGRCRTPVPATSRSRAASWW